jgi:hypothetical protein
MGAFEVGFIAMVGVGRHAAIIASPRIQPSTPKWQAELNDARTCR